MILTCPSCGTRYQTERSRIAPPGLNVRCAKCLEVWFQAASDSDVELDPDPIVVPPPAPRPMRAAISGEEEREDEGDERGFRPSLLFGWLALFLFIGGFIWAAVNYRNEIASFWPQSASFYTLLHLPVNTVGLSFADVTQDQDVEGGEPYLHITGRVENVTTRELPVPEIYISLRDFEERELYAWTVIPDARTLQPGQSLPFVTRLPNPPPETRRADIRFVATIARP